MRQDQTEFGRKSESSLSSPSVDVARRVGCSSLWFRGEIQTAEAQGTTVHVLGGLARGQQKNGCRRNTGGTQQPPLGRVCVCRLRTCEEDRKMSDHRSRKKLFSFPNKKHWKSQFKVSSNSPRSEHLPEPSNSVDSLLPQAPPTASAQATHLAPLTCCLGSHRLSQDGVLPPTWVLSPLRAKCMPWISASPYGLADSFAHK